VAARDGHVHRERAVALVKVMRRGGVLEFSDYKKFGVDTSVTYGRPKMP